MSEVRRSLIYIYKPDDNNGDNDGDDDEDGERTFNLLDRGKKY